MVIVGEMNHPCPSCPFTGDRPIEVFAEALSEDTFPCHLSLGLDDELNCKGRLVLIKKLEDEMIPVSGVKPIPVPTDPVASEAESNWRDRVREVVLPIYFDTHGTHFFDADGKMIAQIRGWGGLTSSGLTDAEAYQIQLQNGLMIAQAVNEVPELRKQVAELEKANERLRDQLDDCLRESLGDERYP